MRQAALILFAFFLFSSCATRYGHLQKVKQKNETRHATIKQKKQPVALPPIKTEEKIIIAKQPSLLPYSTKQIRPQLNVKEKNSTTSAKNKLLPVTPVDSTSTKPAEEEIKLHKSNFKEVGLTFLSVVASLVVFSFFFGLPAIIIISFFYGFVVGLGMPWLLVSVIVGVCLLLLLGIIILPQIYYGSVAYKKRSVFIPFGGGKIALGQIKSKYSLGQYRKRQKHNAFAGVIIALFFAGLAIGLFLAVPMQLIYFLLAVAATALLVALLFVVKWLFAAAFFRANKQLAEKSN